MNKLKYLLLLLLAVPLIAYGIDKVITSPSGNLIFDVGSGGEIKFNKGITGPGTVPIGGMVAVMPTTHANAWQPPASGVIKDGFMRADGAVVPACADCVIPAGTGTPNMTAKYPRGNTTSGGSGGANTQPSNVTVATQPAFNVPGHYHGMGTGANLSVDINHDHPATDSSSAGTSTDGGSHGHNFGGWIARSTNNSTIQVYGPGSLGGGITGSVDAVTATEHTNIAHSHTVTTSTDLPPLGETPKTPTGNIGLVTGGSNGNSAFAATRATDVALTNTAVNNEPSYIEVVWVIRVK